MSTIKINELASSNISLSDFFVKANSAGLASKSTILALSDLLNTVDDTAFKGSIAIADVPTQNGWYFASESGTYTNCGGLVIDTSDNIAIIIISGTFDTFNKVDIPINITIDTTVNNGSANAVDGNAVFDEYKHSSLMTVSNPSDGSFVNYQTSTSIFTIPNDAVLATDNGDAVVVVSGAKTVDISLISSPVKIVYDTVTLAFSGLLAATALGVNEKLFAIVRKVNPSITISCDFTIDGFLGGLTIDSVVTDGSTNPLNGNAVFDANKLAANLWLSNPTNVVYTANQLTALNAVVDVKIVDAIKSVYSIKVVTKNDATFGNRIIIVGDSTDYIFDSPSQISGAAFNASGVNKLLLTAGTSSIYLEIDYTSFSDGIVLNTPNLFISNAMFFYSDIFGIPAINQKATTNETNISTNASNLTSAKRLVQINKLGDNYISIIDGVTRKKVVFPDLDTGYFSFNGGYYKFPRNVEYEFSANYKVLCVDLTNLPGSNEGSLTLVEQTAYANIDSSRYVPIISRWNSDDRVYIYPRFKQFFADDLTSGLNVLALGDSIWDENAYPNNGLKRASDSLGFALNNCATGGSTYNYNFITSTSSNIVTSTSSKIVTDSGGSFTTDFVIGYTLYQNNSARNFIGIVESIESDTSLTLVNNAAVVNSTNCRIVYTSDSPVADTRSSNFGNSIRLALKRINVDGTHQAPNLILIALGTNGITFDEDYPSTLDQVMATATYATMASNLLQTTQGGFRDGVEQLMTAFQNAQIIIFTPRQVGEDTSSGGRTYARLSTRADKIIEISKRYSVEVVDYLSELQICGVFENAGASGRFLSDGVHPNDDGKLLEKNFLVNKLKTVIIKK